MPQDDYSIHCEPLFTALRTIDVQALIDQVEDPWYNQTLHSSNAGCNPC